VLQELAPISLDEGDDERDRAAERVNVPYPARVIVGDDQGAGAQDVGTMTAHLVNLSDGGAALRVYGRFEPGDSARLIIDMANAPVVIAMRAVWTRNLPGGRMVGVTFSRVAPAQQAVIAKLLADHSC
jgi:hypothetical protein